MMNHDDLLLTCMRPGGVSAFLILSGDQIAKLSPKKFVPKDAKLEVEFEPYIVERDCSLLASRLVIDGVVSEIAEQRVKLRKGEVVDYTGVVNVEEDDDSADWWKS